MAGACGHAERVETIVLEPGEAHRFWNAGQEDLRCTGYIQPADIVEYFLTAIYESQTVARQVREVRGRA